MKCDVYLTSGCRKIPDLSDLGQKYPILLETDFQAYLLERSPKFLGLDMLEEDAVVLWRRLECAQGRGLYLPSSYRTPRISREEAFQIAERWIVQRQAERWPNIAFDPLQFCSEDAMWWTFCSGSEAWRQQGLLPGALYALIDKLDGHLWQAQETEALGIKLERLRQAG